MERKIKIGELTYMKYINVIIIVFYCSTTYCQSTGYVLQKLDGTTNLPDSAISIGKITGIKQWLANNLKTINGSNLWGGTNMVITGVDTTIHSTKANVQKIKDSLQANINLKANASAISNIDNTSDLNKPISTAEQTALNGKLATNGSAASLTNFPTLNQNTSGTAAGLSTPLSFANGGIGSGAATSATTGTMTVSMTTEIITITPTNACTFNASGGVMGQRVTFVITTSGVSSFVLTWGTNYRTTGTLATGTTTAKIFCVTFLYNGSLWLETNRTAAM